MHRYNWKRSLPDKRDLKYSAVMPSKSVLPESVDLLPTLPPIVDQGQIGSCTGNGWARAFGQAQIKALQAGGLSAEVYGKHFNPVSRLFIYWFERFIEGDVNGDNGAQVRDGAKALAKYGVCRETAWHYNDANMLPKPSKSAMAEASRHKITNYYNVKQDANHIKTALASNLVVVFGFTVYESFESDQVAETGMVPMPNGSEQVLGGHCVALTGYDSKKGLYTADNSWGTDWGAKGRCFFPEAFIEDSGYCDDFWVMVK